MKKTCLIASLVCASAMSLSAQDASRAGIAWQAPEFVESEWTYIGKGLTAPGIFDYFTNEYPETLQADVYRSRVTPGDYWITPDISEVNPEEYLAPGPFIAHMQNPDKVWTDPIWSGHPMIFCFFPLIPEIMGIQGSESNYGKLGADGVVMFPAKSYFWGSNPTAQPVSNLEGNFGFFIPDDSGVTDMTVDAQAPVYYNLQGIEVANPDNGIFIERRGNVSKKVKF